MRIKLEIDLALTPLQRRVMRWGVVVGVAIGAVGIGVAFAWSDTTWIKAGQPVSAAALLQNITELQAQLTDPTCPPGYALTSPDAGAGPIVCASGYDEVVKVGTGATCFWVDRYEASIWSSPGAPDGATQYSPTSTAGKSVQPTYPLSFPQNGQRIAGGFVPLYAVSKAGVQPSGAATWFQALEACAASGKRLPTGDEWLRAASGTVDGPGCVVSASGPRATGMGSQCASAWGAQDMIGNLFEWTGDWFAAPYVTDAGAAAAPVPWPTAPYNADNNYNVASGGFDVTGAFVLGLPVTALRGGAFAAGTGGGVFALSLTSAPSGATPNFGFRCVIPR